MNTENQRISIQTGKTIELIELREILQIKTKDSGTLVQLINGRNLESNKPLKYFDDLLTGHNFFRAHKAHLVNLYHVKKFQKITGTMVLSDLSSVEVAFRKKNLLIRTLCESPLLKRPVEEALAS